MNSETCTLDMISPSDERETSVGYGIDEERWLALSEAGRFALAVASLDTEQESFKNFDELTKTLKEVTALDKAKVVELNISFRDRWYFDRTGFGTAGPLKLSLNDRGYKFLEEELAKVQ